MPERQRVEFWVWQGSECYRLEIMFHDVLETVRCSLADGDADALVLKVLFLLRIFFFLSFLFLFFMALLFYDECVTALIGEETSFDCSFV